MSTRRKAISAIQKQGILLVYPLDNKREPLSIWSELYPRTKMRWEWDSGGDHKVSDLWILREELSRSRQVVYAKWFRGRATFFSRDIFRSLLRYFSSMEFAESLRASDAARILETLEMDSPLSTKQLKEAVELQGRLFEAQYNRAMKPLWQRLLIVGFGEMDDSSFPSLQMGATKHLFEDLWLEAQDLDRGQAEDHLLKTLGAKNPFFLFAQKIISR